MYFRDDTNVKNSNIVTSIYSYLLKKWILLPRITGANMKLFYRVFSSGHAEEQNKAPIIMLHGLGFSNKSFKIVAPIISKKTKRKVYVPDACNHGNSPWTQEINYDMLTNDLLEFMNEHNIQKAVVLGNSMGGRIAMIFALKYPDKVEALIIEDMTPQNVASRGTNIVQLARTFLTEFLKNSSSEATLDEVKEVAVDAVTAALHPKYVDKEKFLRNLDLDIVPIIKDENGFRLECNVDTLTSMLEGDALVQNLPDQNLAFYGDALFLYGSRAFFNLGKDPSIKKLFPRAIIKRIEGSCHMIHVDSPDLYSQIVSDFILHRHLPESKY